MIFAAGILTDAAGIVLGAASLWSPFAGYPLWAAAAVFYRTLYTGLHPALTTAYGLADDALHGRPLGVSSLIYLILQMILERNRRHFAVNAPWLCWAQFSGLCLVFGLWQGITTAVLTAAAFPLYVLAARRKSGTGQA